MAKILITGGSGYVGSHVCDHLYELGHDIANLDIIFNPSIQKKVKFFECDVRNYEKVNLIFKEFSPDIVIHLAALVSVKDSMCNPIPYYEVNTNALVNILKAMSVNGVTKFIFASTAAVYSPNIANMHSEFISENHVLEPVNTYGKSKLLAEKLIRNLSKDLDLNSIIFRLFNAVGTDSGGSVGIRTREPTTLLPCAVLAMLTDHKTFNVYGNDYDTKDGTAVRDFVSVIDIAKAHELAINFMKDKAKVFEIINLGSRTGISVLEVIHKIQEQTGQQLNINYCDRRPGDTAKVVASYDKAYSVLDWKPSDCSLDEAILNTYNWYKN